MTFMPGNFLRLLKFSVEIRSDETALVVGDSALSFGAIFSDIEKRRKDLEARFHSQSTPYLPLLVDRSLESHLAVATALVHEIPFVLIDGLAPKARIDSMLSLCRKPAMGWWAETVSPDVIPSLWKNPPRLSEPAVAEPGSGFVITTSGTTGTPKGVEISFAAHYSRMELDFEENALGPHSEASFVPLHFIGGLNRITRVLEGHRLHVFDAMKSNLDDLLHGIRDAELEILHLPPQLARLLGHHRNSAGVRFPTVKILRVASEGVRFEALQGMRKYLQDDTMVRHGIGSTEALRGMVNFFRLGDSPDTGLVPVGQPTDHARLVARSGFGEPVYELFIGGPTATGYLNNPEHTNERFVEIEGKRFWKSGDFVKETEPGIFSHVGRADDIVKVRGLLASPSETTAQLMALDGVRAAVTLPLSVNGTTRLVSHIEVDGELPEDASGIRGQLAALLPAHLVPQQVLIHDQLPTNSRGKIDRDALKELHRKSLRDGVGTLT